MTTESDLLTSILRPSLEHRRRTVVTKQESTCRLCASEVNTQRAAYTFAWGAAQDCTYHRSLWESADDAAHRSGCPFDGATCPRLHCERSAA